MKNPLVRVLVLCLFVSSTIAVVSSHAATLSKGDAVKTTKPTLLSPTTVRTPEATRPKSTTSTPARLEPAKSPGLPTKIRTSPVIQPTFKTMIRPVQATQAPQPPIIQSIAFNGYDAIGNLRWTVGLHNNQPTEFPLALWVTAQQCRAIQSGLQCDFAGNVIVTPRPLAPGQTTLVSGSFARFSGYNLFKTRLKSGPTTFHEMEAQLPPDLSYQAQIASINITSDQYNPVQIQVQNTGTNAIPVLSVQKLCAHSSAPGNFTGCGGSALNNILPNQTVTSNQALPLGWPTNPNIMKVRLSRGVDMLDEEMFYPQ